MTIYRKLAASSIAAIERALNRRLNRLIEGEADGIQDTAVPEGVDLRYIGEWEENFKSQGNEFFHGEMNSVKDLIKKAGKLLNKDSKSHAFIEDIVDEILRNNPNEKILIFTEYRATQSYLFEIIGRALWREKSFLDTRRAKTLRQAKRDSAIRGKRPVSHIY